MNHESINIDFDPESILRPLFSKALNKDEFEFCCTLMRIRGNEGSGWDPLTESNNLMDQLLSLIRAPIENIIRIRLLLFLYCHVTEMDDLYNVVGNLLRVCRGERYSYSPFMGTLHSSKQVAITPYSKVVRIIEWSNEIGFADIGRMLDHLLVKQVRNAFFHSDYIVHNDHFNIRHGEGVTINNVITRAVPLEWLVPRLELGINFSLTAVHLIKEYAFSYKTEKIVKGRIGHDDSLEDMLLMVNESGGLLGFRSLKDEDRKKLFGNGT